MRLLIIYLPNYVEELAEKLSANLKDINLDCRGNILRITLCFRSCQQPDSLTCAVS